MLISVARVLVSDILGQGRARYPAAACGVLLGRPGEAGVALVVEASRGSAAGGGTPTAAEIEDARRAGAVKGLDFVGLWRTRPDGDAGAEAADLAAAGPGRACLVASVRKGEPGEWAFWTPAPGGGQAEPVVVRLA